VCDDERTSAESNLKWRCSNQRVGAERPQPNPFTDEGETKMKTHYMIGLIASVTVLLLSACTAVAPAPQEQVASEGTTTESESMDEESMDEESMGEESMGEESMGEESMGEESMDEEMMGEPVAFTLTIENISDASMLPSPLAPGAYAVHAGATPLFVEGQADQGMGLEALAEDGDPSALATALGENSEAIHSGAFNTPDGADGPGPLPPGASYSFDFKAAPGEQLSFASMFVQSNDLFFAPDSAGITLFDEAGNALSGDVTEAVLLWDAGTEVNEEPGMGENQAPRQAGPNTGDDEMGVVRLVDDMYSHPATGELIRVTLTANEDM